MAEYNNSSPGAACNYATLSHYNSHGTALNVPVPAQQRGSNGLYVVPDWGLGFGYNALTHGQTVGSCSGFFNITDAYGKNASNCNTQYVKRLCNGGPVGTDCASMNLNPGTDSFCSQAERVGPPVRSDDGRGGLLFGKCCPKCKDLKPSQKYATAE